MNPARSRADAGIALMVVLWMLTALSVLAIGFAGETRVEARTALNVAEIARARALADAGIHRGIAALFMTDPEIAWQLDGAPYPVELAGGVVTISIWPDTGLIDINSAPDELIRSLIASTGIENDRIDPITDAILDWRDEDDLVHLNGAEADDYEAAGLPYGPRNGYFETVDELAQVLGMDRALYAALEPAITVYSGHTGINAAVAPRPALLAVPGVMVGEVDALLEVRKANQFAETPVPLPPLNGVSDWLVDDEGPVFRIRASARTGSGARFAREAAVWIPEAGDARPYWILDWREAGTDQTGPGEEADS